MGGRSNGLTLEGLAQRLEGLERENAELRSKVVTLEDSGRRQDELPALRGSSAGRDRQTAAFEGEVSRRALLTKAGAAALGTVAAGALMLRDAPEARAHVTNQIVQAHQVLTHTLRAEPHLGGAGGGGIPVRGVQNSSVQAAVYGTNAGSYVGVEGGASGAGAGVLGVNDGPGPGVRGYGVVVGVRGLGKTGVWGSSEVAGHSGVYGQHTGSGYGVVGDGGGSGSAGVLGRNPTGTGVRGDGSTTAEVAGVLGKHSNAGFEAIGVKGETVDGVGVKGTGKTGVIGESPTLGHAAVYGQHTGTAGFGVVGDGTGSDAGVLGRNTNGIGVRGDGRNGVHGKATSGYGGQFEGGKAQLMLKPKGGTAGKPTTGAHLQGEISMDSAATLWVCTVSGSPGTWMKVATTAD